MKMFTDEWREASRQLHESLKSYMKNCDMGVTTYQKDSRRVAIKHRMRRDKAAVDTISCWEEHDKDDFPEEKWLVTTATPTGESIEKLAPQLVNFLETGEIPSIKLATYPGYEDM